MKSAKVSILIPTHNRAALLPDALHSALAQTYENIEILILDNASQDDTPAVVAKYTGDPRVRSLRHTTDLGITGNWRAGIAACEGDFFCLLHDDDTLEPEFVASLVAPLAADDGLVLAFSDHWCMDAQAKRLIESTNTAAKQFKRDRMQSGKVADFARAALVDTSIPVGATLFRRASVTPDMIESRALGSIDMWLLYGCWKTGMGAYYVSSRLMNYRQHSGGMSGSQPLYMAEGHLFRYTQMLADSGLAAIHTDIRRMRAQTLCDYGIGLMAAGRMAESNNVLRDSLFPRLHPRALVAYLLSSLGRPGQSATRWIRQKRRSRTQSSTP